MIPSRFTESPVIVASFLEFLGSTGRVSPPLLLLIQPDGAGAQAKAVSLMDESLAVTSELGMRPGQSRLKCR